MTFRERLEQEKDNLTRIFLFNDRGLFYNAVERSAYAFHTRIKPFKVNVKKLKGLDTPFACIGVPANKLETYLQNLTVEKDEHGNIIAHLSEPVNEKAFLAWKRHVIEQNAKKVQLVDVGSAIDYDEHIGRELHILKGCLRGIQLLNIASMTPMETMVYLNELQKKLKTVKL